MGDKNRDFRVAAAFAQNVKVKNLLRLNDDGYKVFFHLMVLWGYCASNFTDGVFKGLDEDDIEICAQWDGKRGDLIKALTGKKTKFLDCDDKKVYSIHDWKEHNWWCAGWEGRSERGRNAAHTRYTGKPATEHAAQTHPARGCPSCHGTGIMKTGSQSSWCKCAAGEREREESKRKSERHVYRSQTGERVSPEKMQSLMQSLQGALKGKTDEIANSTDTPVPA